MSKHLIAMGTAALVMTLARAAAAQNEPVEPPPLPPSNDPLAEPPAVPPPAAPNVPPPETEPPREENEPRYRPRPLVAPREEPEPMSEGRRIVVAWNTGFQWGLSPGVVFANDKASFFLGLRFGYGFDTGKVIVVPGVRLAGYFTDPNVYVGMPVMKLVYPIDRFAPFIEGGAGAGYIAGYALDNKTNVAAATGFALLIGAGFMVHFTARFGLGVEGTYQTITGTGFDGFGVGPIVALAF